MNLFRAKTEKSRKLIKIESIVKNVDVGLKKKVKGSHVRGTDDVQVHLCPPYTIVSARYYCSSCRAVKF